MRIIILIVSFFLLNSHSIYGQNMHLFLLGDTVSSLKGASKKDLKNIRKDFSQVAQASNLRLYTHEIKGGKADYKALSSMIARTRTLPTDVILFYYTGHGVRNKMSTSRWPAIYFPKNRQAVESTAIINQLNKKPHSLCVILADCCNETVSGKAPSLFSRPFINRALSNKTSSKKQCAGYRSLFSGTKGLIIASGAIPGKRSWCTEKGSFFTKAFLLSLKHEQHSAKGDWSRIFNRTKQLCKDYQTPQYELNIRN